MAKSVYSDDPRVAIEHRTTVRLSVDDLDELQEGGTITVPVSLNKAVDLEVGDG